MAKGDRVVAIRDIGGVARDFVPKGSVGHVTECTWSGRPTKVLFTVKGGMFAGDKKVEITVSTDEVA